MLYCSSRRRRAVSGSVTPYTASQALADAMRCASGQTPQMRGVMRGISSTGRPSQNFSNPRSSGTWKKQSATLPSASRKMSILPWPSRRVMGSMLIRRYPAAVIACGLVMPILRPSLGDLEQAGRKREAAEASDRVRDARDECRRALLGPGLDQGAHGADHGGGLVFGVRRRAVAALAGHVGLHAESAAPAARGRAEAHQPLLQET